MDFEKVQTVAVALTMGHAVEGRAHTVGPWPGEGSMFAVIDEPDWRLVSEHGNAFDAALAFVRAEDGAGSAA